ncbi:hypothetical protein ABID22_002884 [Pontibacter aydingkolensis]|uniref:Uncharacterized protein n=1 Tax=Pontibacter aydingkolensis TaxID=1911536 RepID=A0ABS7CX80_9BACT|nr:hypothetical protein [Pontibacter aydingkolensis]MBW7468468.1 hypothetical protein [Pontibacter aydingkolensis]
MKLPLLMVLPLVCNIAVSQDCDCSSAFTFVKVYYEQNSPAFQKMKNNPQEYS